MSLPYIPASLEPHAGFPLLRVLRIRLQYILHPASLEPHAGFPQLKQVGNKATSQRVLLCLLGHSQTVKEWDHVVQRLDCKESQKWGCSECTGSGWLQLVLFLSLCPLLSAACVLRSDAHRSGNPCRTEVECWTWHKWEQVIDR